MHVLPSLQQRGLVLAHHPHGTADLATGHAVRPNQLRRAGNANEVDDHAQALE
jgi:hypothetical protein